MTTATRERPILFSGWPVRAILDGRKSQTRRVVRPQPVEEPDGRVHWRGGGWTRHPTRIYDDMLRAFPYGQRGDRLWVRESLLQDPLDGEWKYAADLAPLVDPGDECELDAVAWVATRTREWCPSIHMPRWASRITLEITDVRVEQLRWISRDDAMAEGIERVQSPFPIATWRDYHASDPAAWVTSPITSFASGWDLLNVKRGYGWDANPWVWVVSFRRAPA